MKELETLLKNWETSVWDYLPQLLVAILVFVAFLFLAKLFRKLSRKFCTKVFKKDSDVISVISGIVYFFTLLFGVLLTLDILGFESILKNLLAGAGIVGIVAGFAFKDIVSNAFAGLLLHMQTPFKRKDWVEIAGHYGTVRKIGWITTSIKNISGQEVFVPNQIIYNDTFINYSTFGKRRVIFKSGVSYGDDLDLVKKVTLEEVAEVKAVLKDETVDFYFTSIGSSAYNFEVRFWIRFREQEDYLKAMNEIILRVQKRFAKENISLAYSVMTLDFGVKGGVNLYDNPIQIEQSKQ